jgi:ComF family protein
MTVLDRVLDLVFPPRCPACSRRTERVALCSRCDAAISRIASPICPVCGESFAGAGPDHLCRRCTARTPHFDRARAPALYRHGSASPLIETLYRFKYGRDVTLAPVLGRFLADHCPLPIDHEVVVPVPLDIARMRWRGFNQAVMLGRALALAAGRPLAPYALERRRVTAPQVGLGDAERRRNVAGAFAVRDATPIRGRSVLLVDDVMTTGATVDECARILRRGGAARIDVLVLARVAGT